jgi:uncharacterized membrane protein
VSPVGIALLLMTAGAVALLVTEIYRRFTGASLVSRRRFALRLIAGLLLVSLLVAVFLGLFVLGLEEAGARPNLFLAFWSGCVVIAFLLIFVMLADMREVEDSYSRHQREIWGDFARCLADSLEDSPQEHAPQPDDEPEA